MQYWLGGSDDNIEADGALPGRRAMPATRDWHGRQGRGARSNTPMSASITPTCPATASPPMSPTCRSPRAPSATVGLLMLRSYVLASDTAHYDAVIRAFEAQGLARASRPLPAVWTGAPRSRPISPSGRVDALVSLTGFRLVGGPAYNDSDAAVDGADGAGRALYRRASAGVSDAGPMGRAAPAALARSKRRC